MLKLYRRHSSTCPYAAGGRAQTRCTCPIWCDGTLPDVLERVNCSMDTRNWQVANKRVKEWESAGSIVEDTRIEISSAIDAYLRDAENRNLADTTLKKYRVMFWQLRQFCEHEGLDFIQQFDVLLARKFRESWKDGPLSASKKLERLRQFFRFCVDSGWIVKSPAASIRAPKVPVKETLPFTRSEIKRMLAAAARMEQAATVTAFVLLQRYSGLRIGDAATLEKTRIDSSGRLFLYTAKSRTPVLLPLPELVTNAIAACRPIGEHHFFWTGESSVHTVTGRWRRTLARLFKRAGITGAHPHRFRDTFAVELLVSGTPIEEVSRLLGHRSVRVTEKHYAPWVSARQQRAEALVRSSWETDPLLQPSQGSAETTATNSLQTKGVC